MQNQLLTVCHRRHWPSPRRMHQQVEAHQHLVETSNQAPGCLSDTVAFASQPSSEPCQDSPGIWRVCSLLPECQVESAWLCTKDNPLFLGNHSPSSLLLLLNHPLDNQLYWTNCSHLPVLTQACSHLDYIVWGTHPCTVFDWQSQHRVGAWLSRPETTPIAHNRPFWNVGWSRLSVCWCGPCSCSQWWCHLHTRT